MNCKNFENVVNDLARSQMIDVETREHAHEHAKDCAPCAARLADEQTLSLGLRALSLQTVNVEAPAKVEAALLAAFRAPEKVAGFNVQTIRASGDVRRRRWQWAVAAAAAVAILFVAALNSSHWPKPPTGHTEQTASDFNKNTQSLQTPTTASLQEAVATPEPAIKEQTQKTERKAAPQYVDFKNVSMRRAGVVKGAGKSIKDAQPVDPASSANEAEVATDFMPLTYDAAATPLDSGHLVRVELPRTALLSMGLPMNAERANEYVKADVLMGEDGVARAIRFVR